MKVLLTGWNGFLARKLRECTDIEWLEDSKDSDVLLLMGSPTFTDAELTQHDAQVMHQYVREAIRQIDRYSGPVVFASTTGVDDIQLNHKGSTAYNLAKLYLENYIINNCDKYLILRIGTIVSSNPKDIAMMRTDRVQQRIARKDYKNVSLEDYYLDIETFVTTTVDAICQSKDGILEYQLTKYKISELIKLGQ